MENGNTKEAVIKFSPMEIVISGPTEFVTEQSSQYKELINSIVLKMVESFELEKPNKTPKLLVSQNLQKSEGIVDTDFVEVTNLSNPDYENVFVAVDGKIQIICDIPGKSTAQRMINLILIYMWAKLQLGLEEIDFSELRQVCEHYGEFDSSNFARYINAQKKYFLISGVGKSQKAKLIRPGIKQAEVLLNELNNS